MQVLGCGRGARATLQTSTKQLSVWFALHKVFYVYNSYDYRQRQKTTVMKRVRMIHMFLTNYSKWYRISDPSTTAVGNGRRRKNRHTHVV